MSNPVDAGVEAALDGASVTENPYSLFDKRHELWFRGWYGAVCSLEQEGEQAALGMRTLESNPYPKGSAAYWAWNDGWLAGTEFIEKEREHAY